MSKIIEFKPKRILSDQDIVKSLSDSDIKNHAAVLVKDFKSIEEQITLLKYWLDLLHKEAKSRNLF